MNKHIKNIPFVQESQRLFNGLISEIKLFSIYNQKVRFSLRSAIAISIAMSIAWILKLPDPTWVALSALFASQNTFGGTFEKTIIRTTGTIIGGIAGLLISILFFEYIVLYIVSSAIFCTIALYLSIKEQTYSYAWIMSVLTCVIVIFTNYAIASPSIDSFMTTFLLRTAEVLLGVFVATTCSFFIFKSLSTKTAQNNLVEINLDWSHLYKFVLEKYNGISNDEAFEKAYLQQSARIINLQNLLTTLRFEKKLQPSNIPFERLEQSARNFLQSIIYAYKHITPDITQTKINFTDILKVMEVAYAQTIVESIKKETFIFYEEDFEYFTKKIASHIHKIENRQLSHQNDQELLKLYLQTLKNISTIIDARPMRLLNITMKERLIKTITFELFQNFEFLVFKNCLIRGFSIFTIPFLWELAGWKDIMTVGITICMCMTFSHDASKYKGTQRFFGCLTACIVVILTFKISAFLPIVGYVIIFMALFFYQYINASSSEISYFGLQGIFPLVISGLYFLTPSTAQFLIFDRLGSIIIGIFSLTIIEAMLISQKNTIDNYIQIFSRPRKSISYLLSLLSVPEKTHYESQIIFHLNYIHRTIYDIRKCEDQLIEFETKKTCLSALTTYYGELYHAYNFYLKEGIFFNKKSHLQLNTLAELMLVRESNLDQVNEKIEICRALSKDQDKEQRQDLQCTLNKITHSTEQYFECMDSIIKSLRKMERQSRVV
ncbi:FUSC family protein [Shewanella surugensis]|uniref:FUSC family protein n=1 Tax=Shewanella surugensis TaxID=212020 RepID=A0ABT0LJN8_9GAMM|nr:FUSC family protein [Shewanella surugensis]MCL1127924.1 FUSC family protein [Shewanella surugensis]